jgi:tetratricopeptide (TPR) repeat protein
MQDARAHRPTTDDFVHGTENTEERDLLELADIHLAAGQWGDACKLFHSVAARHPQNRVYRALMHYARGRDYLAERQYRNARAELRRALDLDPTLTAAADALDAATSLLAKLFRR